GQVQELLAQRQTHVRTQRGDPGNAVVDRGRDASLPSATHAESSDSSRRRIFPIGFFGSSGRKRNSSGFLKLARRSRQNVPSSSAVTDAPGRSETKAATR